MRFNNTHPLYTCGAIDGNGNEDYDELNEGPLEDVELRCRLLMTPVQAPNDPPASESLETDS